MRDPLEVPLWSEPDSSAMRVVFPSRPALAAALIVFRGGGYATNRGSGGGAAEWAAANGMVGIEVPYRVAQDAGAFPGAYDDAARAVRLARAHAATWGIDAARVGVLGFSAGGHLAALLSTQPNLRTSTRDDLGARFAARPNFVVLAYPVVSFIDGYEPGAYAGSAANFFGERELSPALRAQFSNERHVSADHPPVFVWTTADDELVPADHARLFAEACERAGVPVRFTLFQHGPHGMGLALDTASDVGTWTQALRAWLVAQGILA